ncbi:hypothetical protein K432DRAFT_377279 [Lepidopterella palustris CBS 459.81]|uniref:HNH nuclease domain-containing protein n=1 Tax=Lepidopterella palustris CBS 459.81 TaxID=1314670 RepID=A0A8E2EKT0_9PEZI|nr:hypothetical protein K432DRAFT_377279 [Lepidopterella palustris CBS 459.81]
MSHGWSARLSCPTATRTQALCDGIRSRDRRCVISGTEAFGAHIYRWTGFEAAHIFPLAYEGSWNDHKHVRWTTIPLVKGRSISSVQNGLLLRSDVH